MLHHNLAPQMSLLQTLKCLGQLGVVEATVDLRYELEIYIEYIFCTEFINNGQNSPYASQRAAGGTQYHVPPDRSSPI